MKGEFLRVITSDGLELQGLLSMPESETSLGLIHVHGLDGNFYENRFIDSVCDVTTRLGIAFLTVNTRGHDYISDLLCVTDEGLTYKQIGGIYEIFEECLLDLDAWIDLLRSRRINSIILQGHSHGAIKVTYYLHKRPISDVSGLILLSPSDDFGLQRASLGDMFDGTLGLAQKMISEGRGRDLMPAEYFHYPISAATYYDTFGFRSPLKIFNISETDSKDFDALAKITVPTLVIVGTVEEAFIGDPQSYLSNIRTKMKSARDYTGWVIEGAPHNYLGYEAELASFIKHWLGERLELMREKGGG